jgi:hypothetical protein
MNKKMIWIAPLALAAIPLLLFLGGEAVRLLWNWLVPAIFGWRAITFWQALGLLALCRILFGGLGLHGGPEGPRMETRGRMTDRMADRVAARWQTMTAEERARFRDRFRARFGGGPGEPTPVD